MTSNGIYDLEKLNPDKLRLKKRKLLFKRTAIVSFVVIVIAIKLLSLSVLTGSANSYLKANNAQKAIQTLSPLGLLNVIEGYKYHFNKGDAYFRNGEYQKAEAQFRTSQKSVPKNFYCRVTLNLVLSLEAQADQAVTAKDYDKAVVIFDEIKAIVRDAQCKNIVEETKADEQMKQVAERSTKKSDEAKQARNGEKSDQNGKPQTDTTKQNQPTKDQQDKLQKNAEQNIRLRQKRAQENANSNFDYNARKYDAKNW